MVAQAEVDAIELMRTEFGYYGEESLDADENWVKYLDARKKHAEKMMYSVSDVNVKAMM